MVILSSLFIKNTRTRRRGINLEPSIIQHIFTFITPGLQMETHNSESYHASHESNMSGVNKNHISYGGCFYHSTGEFRMINNETTDDDNDCWATASSHLMAATTDEHLSAKNPSINFTVWYHVVFWNIVPCSIRFSCLFFHLLSLAYFHFMSQSVVRVMDLVFYTFL